MRTLLAIGIIALAASFSGLGASAATVGESARSTNVESAVLSQVAAPQAGMRDAAYVRDVAMAAGKHDRSETSVVDAIGTIIALAGAGLLLTMTAVGLRHVWTQDPIRDPVSEGLSDGPGFL
jgi:hypothetical protein